MGKGKVHEERPDLCDLAMNEWRLSGEVEVMYEEVSEVITERQGGEEA